MTQDIKIWDNHDNLPEALQWRVTVLVSVFVTRPETYFLAVAFATALAPSFHAEEDAIFQVTAGQVVETVALVHFAVLPL